jgi:hypothetical protein
VHGVTEGDVIAIRESADYTIVTNDALPEVVGCAVRVRAVDGCPNARPIGMFRPAIIVVIGAINARDVGDSDRPERRAFLAKDTGGFEASILIPAGKRRKERMRRAR